MAAGPGNGGRSKLVLGVYVVTAAGLVPGRGHAEVAIGAISGGANAVELRAPEYRDEDLLPLARELADRARERGVLFILEDRVELAPLAGAAGVHLPWGVPITEARLRLGPDLVLGVSVGNAQQARTAEAAGANYLCVAITPAPATAATSMPASDPDGLGRVREISAATSLPVVGMGDVQARDARRVLDAGAAGVGVTRAVAAAADPAAATRELVATVRGTTGAPPYES